MVNEIAPNIYAGVTQGEGLFEHGRSQTGGAAGQRRLCHGHQAVGVPVRLHHGHQLAGPGDRSQRCDVLADGIQVNDGDALRVRRRSDFSRGPAGQCFRHDCSF